MRRVALVILGVAMVAALAAYCWRGWYAHYVTDDYCTAGELRAQGFLDAMRYHRHVWSGRFSYFAIKAALESIGPVTAKFTPGVLIALLTAAIGWTTRRVLPTLVLVFAIVDSSPSLANIGGSLYWETGSLSYFLPLVLFASWVGLFRWDRSLTLRCVLSFLLLFVAGGLSETSLAAQGAMTFGAMLLAPRSSRAIAISGFVATLLAFAIVASAPGNFARATAMHLTPLSPGAALLRTFTLANDFLGSYVFAGSIALLPVIAVAFVAGSEIPRRLLIGASLIALSAYGISFLPTAWIVPAGPPERALDVPNFFLIAALYAAARTLAPSQPRNLATSVAIALCAIIPIRSTITTIRAIPEARTRAQQVAEMDRYLRTQRGRPVVLRAKWAIQNRLLHEDRDFWINRCVSRYYSLQSLQVVP